MTSRPGLPHLFRNRRDSCGNNDLPCHTAALSWPHGPDHHSVRQRAAFAALSDDELVERVKHLAACERRASVALIRSLVEFDARRLYLREGCSSLFTYCTHVLHLSEGSAYNRIETARAARRSSGCRLNLEIVCLSSVVPQHAVMPIIGWSSTAMAARDQHVDLLGALLGTVTSLLYHYTTFARGLSRSIHLAVSRIEKSFGSRQRDDPFPG